MAQTAARPFDLAIELPIRLDLYELDSDHHVLLIVLHHIACDGASFAPLLRDLDLAYAARSAGTPPAWDPLPVQYLDFAEWQRELLGSEDDPDSMISAQLEYWSKRLADLPDKSALPFQRTATDRGERRAEILELWLPAELHARLLQLGRAAACTPFMVLQAAVSSVLYRCGEGEDIVLGTPVSGRTAQELDDLIGFFVNNVVLRLDLSGRLSFRALLDQVRMNNIDAYANQDVPFDRLVTGCCTAADRRINRCSASRWCSSTTMPRWSCTGCGWRPCRSTCPP